MLARLTLVFALSACCIVAVGRVRQLAGTEGQAIAEGSAR